MTQPVDSSILHEIVRVVDSRRKVPDKVVVASKEYLLTYLEDHRHRLEEALMRFDADRLNMLYGQLASKVKYQLLRRVPTRAAAAMGLGAAASARAPAAKRPARAAKPAAKRSTATGKKAAAKKVSAPKKRPAAAAKKAASPKKAKAPARRAAARPKKKSRR